MIQVESTKDTDIISKWKCHKFESVWQKFYKNSRWIDIVMPYQYDLSKKIS